MRRCLLLLALCFPAFTSYTQGIQYQAVARDADGQILANRPMSIIFSIFPSGDETPAYEERHELTTDAFGQFTLVIGQGEALTGEWEAVDWAAGPPALEIELDAGDGPQFLGRVPLQSVPHSFFAQRAAEVDLPLNGLIDVDVASPETGQILKWNGSAWVAADDAGEGVSYTSGNGITINNGVISNTGDTDPDDDITTSSTAGGDLSGNFSNLQLNPNAVGSAEIDDGSIQASDLAPGTIPSTLPPSGAAAGDLDGNYPNPTVSGLRGRAVAENAPTANQVLKWNGNEWAPAEDVEGISYTAGQGIAISGEAIINTGDTDPSDDITSASSAGGDLSGNFSNLQLNPNAVGSAEIDDGSIQASDLAPGTIPSALPPSGAAAGDLDGNYPNPTVGGLRGRAVADLSPSNAQVLAWNGSQNHWQPATLNFPSFQAGNGIAIINSTIINTGDTNPNDDITESSSAGGDVAGNYGNLIVRGLFGRSLASQAPVPGQALIWNGSAWAPDSIRTSGGSSLWSPNGNRIFYNNGFVGIGTTNPLSKLHLFGGDLIIQDNFPVLTLNGSGSNKIISFQINGTEQGNIIYSNGIGLRANGGGDFSTGSWVLSPDGNFGLGLNDPQRKLHVHFDNNNGSTSQMLISQAGGGDAWLNFGLDGSTHYAVGIDNSDGDKFKIGYHPSLPRGTGENTRLTINSIGRVGIGTTNPSVKLDVNGALKLGTTTVTDNGIIRWTGSDFEGRKGNQWVSLTEVGTPVWSQSGSSAFYNNGRVGIGTSNPATELDVNGNMRASGEVRTTRTGSAHMVPIAYGNVSGNGSINRGTGNFSVSRTAAGTYQVTLNGENFFFEDYIVHVTLAGEAGFSSYSSINGKLLIKTFNLIGVVVAADRSFSFVVYEP